MNGQLRLCRIEYENECLRQLQVIKKLCLECAIALDQERAGKWCDLRQNLNTSAVAVVWSSHTRPGDKDIGKKTLNGRLRDNSQRFSHSLQRLNRFVLSH